jgi:hypothetical protein
VRPSIGITEPLNDPDDWWVIFLLPNIYKLFISLFIKNNY